MKGFNPEDKTTAACCYNHQASSSIQAFVSSLVLSSLSMGLLSQEVASLNAVLGYAVSLASLRVAVVQASRLQLFFSDV